MQHKLDGAACRNWVSSLSMLFYEAARQGATSEQLRYCLVLSAGHGAIHLSRNG